MNNTRFYAAEVKRTKAEQCCLWWAVSEYDDRIFNTKITFKFALISALFSMSLRLERENLLVGTILGQSNESLISMKQFNWTKTLFHMNLNRNGIGPFKI